VGANGAVAKLNKPTQTVLLWEMQQLAFNPTPDDGIDGPLSSGTGDGYLGSPIGSGWFVPQYYKRASGGNCVAGTPVAACLDQIHPTGTSFGERTVTGSGANSVTYITFSKVAVHTTGINCLAADGHVKWVQSNLISTGINPEDSTIAQGDPCQGGFVSGCAAGTDSMRLPSGRQALLTMSTN
jgi:prepilin-type processing-associated H-X9-DG protein